MRNLIQTMTWIVCLATWLSADVRAQQWTRFRGPNGSGVSQAKTIPTQWTDADYRWKTPLPGKGHSSPVVWGDRLFLLSADPAHAARHLLCLHVETGAVLWEKTFDSQPHSMHLRNSYASSTPTVDQQHVYVAWATPSALLLKAFDHQGNEVWSADLGRWPSQHGFGTSPILFEDTVILSNSQQAEQLMPPKKTGQGQSGQWRLAPLENPGESSMMAFDRMTGEVRWKTPRVTTRVCYPTPCIYREGSGREELICYSTGDGIYSLDARTGEPNWSIDVFKMRNVNSPIVVGDLIFAANGSGGGGNYLVAVHAGDQPKEAYRVTRQAPYVPTPVALGELVFVLSDRGFASCIEAADGSVVWRKRLPDLAFSGSPVIVDDRIYCIDESGVVVVLAAGRTFKELARNPLGEPSRATPAVAGGCMFLRTESHLFCIGSPVTP